MVIVSKGKSVRVSTEPEEDSPSKDLVNVMRDELHERNEKKVKEN